MNEIRTYNLRYSHENREMGEIFDVTCPKCKDKIEVGMHDWTQPKCSCGYRWSIDLQAHGQKSNE